MPAAALKDYGVIYNWDGAPAGYNPPPQTMDQLLDATFAPLAGTQVLNSRGCRLALHPGCQFVHIDLSALTWKLPHDHMAKFNVQCRLHTHRSASGKSATRHII